MMLDDDEILQLKDTLGDAYEKAEGIRQLLFALHISDNIDDIIDHHSFGVLANQQAEVVSLLKEAVAIANEAEE